MKKKTNGGGQMGLSTTDYHALVALLDKDGMLTPQSTLSLCDALAVVLAELMAMSDDELLLFQQVYNGANYPQAARALGYTKMNARSKFSRLARVSRLFAEFERYRGRGDKGARHNPPAQISADVMRQLEHVNLSADVMRQLEHAQLSADEMRIMRQISADAIRELERKQKTADAGGENTPRVYTGCYA